MDNIFSKQNSLNKGLIGTLISGLCFLFTLSVGAQTTKTAITGTWLNQEKAAKIEIYQQGDQFFGKIVWLKEPDENGKPKTDIKNPDKARHKDPIIGLVMLKNVEFDGRSTWKGGTIYDSRSGKTYSCYLTLQADKSLKVRSYVGVSLFGQSTVWTRIN
ncbi:DUF2147 domain-containing protein [Mucilaginibacter rigui]|uniref:DUF2147 domain-containing protein n=1 Tax=Mucilaginibacter rigui TaxID=534635 RepID=A0ABR7X7W7_9SPHI|nr:DUF2147 domain-containing protein [Mucilaginibacter rigui]MBD1386665.1 DUF2147 domain-containing protein [Mucilaginibacter rigui]